MTGVHLPRRDLIGDRPFREAREQAVALANAGCPPASALSDSWQDRGEAAMRMLCEDDLNLGELTDDDRERAWDLWFSLTQVTNEAVWAAGLSGSSLERGHRWKPPGHSPREARSGGASIETTIAAVARPRIHRYSVTQ
jgi:hypothetical protein